jgi:hypothetical protein
VIASTSIYDSEPKESFHPIVLKVMTEEETKEYHLKRLERLALTSTTGAKIFAGKGSQE